MDFACGWVELVVGVAEAEFFEDVGRRGVFGMMSGEQTFEAEGFKCIRDDGLRGFRGKSFAPELRKEVETEFEDLLSFVVWPKPAAAGESAIFENKDRPVLEFVGELVGNFARQTFDNLWL